jgi:hypothetical protein
LRRHACSRVALGTKPASLDQLRRGADDAVADDQDGYGRPADDVDLGHRRRAAGDRRHVGADQLVDGFQNALFRNAHQNDGLLVFDELQSGQYALRIDADQKTDRLAGIAGRIDEVGIQVNKTLQLFAAIDRNDGRLALRRTEAVGFGKEVGGRSLRQICSEVAGGQGGLCA